MDGQQIPISEVPRCLFSEPLSAVGSRKIPTSSSHQRALSPVQLNCPLLIPRRAGSLGGDSWGLPRVPTPVLHLFCAPRSWAETLLFVHVHLALNPARPPEQDSGSLLAHSGCHGMVSSLYVACTVPSVTEHDLTGPSQHSCWGASLLLIFRA